MPRRFLAERRRDPYYRAAQREGRRSRASYKLDFLLDRFPLLRRGSRVLDLGAAPGGWALAVRERLGSTGEVVAVDSRPLEPIPGVTVVRGRVGDPVLARRLGERRFDLVLSDLSPRISGAYATDHARSVGLVQEAFGLAEGLLVSGGSFVAKVFAGDLLEDLEAGLRPSFDALHRTKPPASRGASSEMYLVGVGYRRHSDEGP